MAEVTGYEGYSLSEITTEAERTFRGNCLILELIKRAESKDESIFSFTHELSPDQELAEVRALKRVVPQ